MACLFVPALSAHATEWFISPQGDDANAGTSERAPFKTLQKADAMLVPGDTITVLDGTYPAVADFRLQPGSPAIGAASSTPPPNPDIGGTSGAASTTYDLGAYQHH